MRKKKKPVLLENVTIEKYAAEGRSLGRVDGKVVFVEKVVPGDVVDVWLTKNKEDWAEGYPHQYHTYSPQRVQPFCEHFGVCGGCTWQMLPYHLQLEYKQQQVTDQLTRIGGLELPETMPIIGADPTEGYRNKLEFTFSNRRYLTREEMLDPTIFGEGHYAGFHVKGMYNKVVNVNKCHLMAEPVNVIREALKAKAIELGLPFYDLALQAGWIRAVQYRYCTTGDLMVNVILGYEQAEARKALLDDLLEKAPEITTLFYTINHKLNDSMADLTPVHYYGERDHAIEQLGRFRFKISPISFFQTNSRQAEVLYEVTRRFANLDGTQTVYDLYCGTGSIGIYVSDGAKKIIGVEVVDAAVQDARENASMNGIGHAQFFTGDVSKVCTDAFFAAHGRPDVIITDPPRAGMSEKLVKQILDMQAPVVVYVSCNPGTQARDLKWLSEKYEVTKVQPVDMFPHTLHIENVVQLRLRN
ncbi:MAG TPA: 23S rRNA (uracil(1939)-C(5))-methyltransferase RlmD [Phnomibacter sp.]|nr:23S rRNA (uracil(1939)-C(5))-methyltransferase RlmD [Phnomibacter sp.]